MPDVTIDPGAAELEPDFVAKPIQVEETEVLFVPKKDFSARVNQDTWNFNKDVPIRIPRSLANMLIEDPERGYIRT